MVSGNGETNNKQSPDVTGVLKKIKKRIPGQLVLLL